mgnify:CR=1 FL=1
MPSSITHAYFGNDLYKSFEKQIRSKINGEMFKTFNQGPDILFFYNIVNLKCGKSVRNFGKYMQKHKTRDFFVNLITYVKDNNLYNNKDVVTFMYGFISHYVLDMTVHPFVFYKTGIYDSKNKNTYKYNGLHNDMETAIDCYLINNYEKIKPKYFKVHKFCFNIKPFSNKLNKTIDCVFKSTFNKDNMSSIYYNSIKHMKLSFRVLRYDPTGIKLTIYKLLDFILPNFISKKSSLSYSINYKRKMHYLNMDKNAWNHPKDLYEVYNYSFIELYCIALKRALELINKVDIYINNNMDIKYLKELFPDLSYTSGKKCKINKETRYFQF